MKVRIKFKKYGAMKYIGHLDIMRYFQKSMRRAKIDIAYSSGFSPHQIMSFAAPLGVGLYSDGEYFDIELNSHDGGQALKTRLNHVMVEGIEIVSVVKLSDKSVNAMACVAAAEYKIELLHGEISSNIKNHFHEFFSQEEIMVKKQTKKNEIQFDLKPHIYQSKLEENCFYLFVDASSSGNIKPSLVLTALFTACHETYQPSDYQITRLDTYTNIKTPENYHFVPLDHVGEEF